MDPISVAASVAGLLSLTIQVSQMLYNQVHTLKNAPKDALKLLDELEALRQVLASLKQFLASQSSKGRLFRETSVLINAIQGCKTQITTMELRLKKTIRAKGLSQMLEREKWYYKRDECQELIRTLNQYLGMFQMSLTVDGLEMLSKSIDAVAQEASIKTQQLNSISQLLTPLASMSKDVSNVTKTIQQWNSKWLNQESQEILNWLSPLNFWAKQDDMLSQKEEGTCEWIFEEFAFRKWLDGTERTLWCPGMPGAGKTILVSTVVDYLQRTFDEEDVGIAFTYCNYKEKGDQTLVNLMLSLLHQLLWKRRTLPARVRNLYEQHIRKKTRPTLIECSELLNLEILDYSKVFLIVDALDECDDLNGTRNDFIEKLLRLPMSTRLLVTSRHVPSIKSQLKHSCHLEIRASNTDMRIYLEQQIQRKNRLKGHTLKDSSLMQAILEKVVEAAQGMFLLAQLHMDALSQKHTPKAVRAALQVLPEELDRTYDEAIKRIRSQNKEDAELAQHILSWLSFALRPLTVTEMRHAIAVEPATNQTSIDMEDLISEDILVSVCAGLVVIDQESEIIRLIHYTTQEYFDRKRQTEFPNGQSDIAKSCLTYLSFEVFQSGYCANDKQMEARLQVNPLFQYAAQNWGNHARKGAESMLHPQILEFLAQESGLSSMVQAMQSQYRYEGYSQRPPRIVFGLWVAATFGLVATAMALLAGGIKCNVQTDQGDMALRAAASNGHEAVVRLLLEKGADIEAKDGDRRTALHRAASNGHEAVVRLLLEKGADIEAKDSLGWTALHAAASSGHEAVVRLLLEKGADIEAKDSLGWTALYTAALNGYEAMVRLLLEKGADIEAKDRDGWTALQEAASNGHEVMVRLLTPVNLNS